MIFALADGSEVVDERHLHAALAVWKYCGESARILFDGVGTSLAHRLRRTVRERPGIMRSELRHSVSHSMSTADFNAALESLLARGEIVCIPVYTDRQALSAATTIRCAWGVGEPNDKKLAVS